MIRQCLPVIIFALFSVCSTAHAEDPSLRGEAAAALKSACRFFADEVSTVGGYLWRYSEDLKTREGEGRADEHTVWVQPPGTPTVGLAFLEAYQATGDTYYFDLAKRAGHCLVRGQLRSGGWDYRIVFDQKGRSRYAYRVDDPLPGKSQRNTSTLDDNTTQAALRLLMALDETVDQSDPAIHEAATAGLETLLKVQYPIGAWPQRFNEPPDPDKYPVRKASYPESWSRTYPKKDYRGYYTFNDNAVADVIDVMFTAADQYGAKRYGEAAEQAGEFMILAQMPDPQPGWAQQYNQDMHPAWARKFETAIHHRAGISRCYAHVNAGLPAHRGQEVPGTDPACTRLLSQVASSRRPTRALLRTENQSPALLHQGLSTHL